MPFIARFLILLGTLIKCLAFAIAIVPAVGAIFALRSITFRELGGTFLFIGIFVAFGLLGHMLCYLVRRRYPMSKPLLPSKMSIAITGVCLQIFGLLIFAGAVLAPAIDPALGKLLTSGPPGYLLWTLPFLFSIMFIAAGVYLRILALRPSTPAQGFQVIPPSQAKE